MWFQPNLLALTSQYLSNVEREELIGELEAAGRPSTAEKCRRAGEAVIDQIEERIQRGWSNASRLSFLIEPYIKKKIDPKSDFYDLPLEKIIYFVDQWRLERHRYPLLFAKFDTFIDIGDELRDLSQPEIKNDPNYIKYLAVRVISESKVLQYFYGHKYFLEICPSKNFERLALYYTGYANGIVLLDLKNEGTHSHLTVDKVQLIVEAVIKTGANLVLKNGSMSTKSYEFIKKSEVEACLLKDIRIIEDEIFAAANWLVNPMLIAQGGHVVSRILTAFFSVDEKPQSFFSTAILVDIFGSAVLLKMLVITAPSFRSLNRYFGGIREIHSEYISQEFKTE